MKKEKTPLARQRKKSKTKAKTGRPTKSTSSAGRSRGKASVEASLPLSLLGDQDLYLFNEGTHTRLYDKLGAHPTEFHGKRGTFFSVWAPDADWVSIIGDFNGWDPARHRMQPKGQSGIWESFVEGIGKGTLYKFHIRSRLSGFEAERSDPFALHSEAPPRTASVVWEMDYDWNDSDWMKSRKARNSLSSPISIYEVHIGSWMRKLEEEGRSLYYVELAHRLAQYVTDMGFTHVEFLPVMEHPFGGSWGYQTTGYFTPTSRYGSPQDFMYLVDILHQNGIGVILDWVPSHFPSDPHGLAFFDGTHLYEHADPRRGFHPDWNSCIFNYGRKEVRSFLISSALFWLDKYHADGIRVDAVASMLYLDYSRKDGEWIPNEWGGRENIEAIDFLRQLNGAVYAAYPDVQTYAEESTSWPMVSRPNYLGGLGFGLKWDMGWMHDTLRYMAKESVHRKFHHNDLTFRLLYAFHENFVLPLSHDEVVHGKGSLLGKMPGDDWQKFANLRALFGYMYAQPGKKLLFMGGEFGQWSEWNHDGSLEWHLVHYPPHSGLQSWVADLNRVYTSEPALYERDFDPGGFEWIDCSDSEQSVISLMRRGRDPGRVMVIVCNFTPVPRHNYRVGVPYRGIWREILNSDAREYWGSGQGNFGGVEAKPIPYHGRLYSLNLTLPPLSVILLALSS